MHPSSVVRRTEHFAPAILVRSFSLTSVPFFSVAGSAGSSNSASRKSVVLTCEVMHECSSSTVSTPVRLPAACIARTRDLLVWLGPRRLLYLTGLRCTAGSVLRCPPARCPLVPAPVFPALFCLAFSCQQRTFVFSPARVHLSHSHLPGSCSRTPSVHLTSTAPAPRVDTAATATASSLSARGMHVCVCTHI
jgi:hypothetical protein